MAAAEEKELPPGWEGNLDRYVSSSLWSKLFFLLMLLKRCGSVLSVDSQFLGFSKVSLLA